MEFESTSLTESSFSGRLKDYLAFVGVGAYLTGVGAYLRVRGKIQPTIPLPVLARSRVLAFAAGLVGQPGTGELTEIQPCARHQYRAKVPVFPTDQLQRSTLELFEDGVSLGPGHDPHHEIEGLGGGRYSHYGIASRREGFRISHYSEVYFSTSDNTDPRTNGRRYTYHVA